MIIMEFTISPVVEAAVQKVQKRIEEAFDVFDHEGNKTVDVREIGTIMRSLDLCPTENELTDVLAEVCLSLIINAEQQSHA